jgi:predicted RNA-binding Zn-ribbon protein involved in translation (DUF1610 family)
MPLSDVFDPRKPTPERPCPKCGAQMRLAWIEPDKPDYDRRTFECPKCAHEEIVVVKYEASVRGPGA